MHKTLDKKRLLEADLKSEPADFFPPDKTGGLKFWDEIFFPSEKKNLMSFLVVSDCFLQYLKLLLSNGF